MVFSGLYPIDGSEYPRLREALDKLQLNDAALAYEPETSAALGFGFRCGFLGLLHLEIVRERLERESGLALISTAPNVVYRVVMEDGQRGHRHQPERDGRTARSPRSTSRSSTRCCCCPATTSARSWSCARAAAACCKGMDYLSEDRVELRYTLPLAEIVFDFFDQLKSRTRGYASLDYEPAGEQAADLVKVDILLQGEPVDAFSAIVHKDKAYAYGVAMTQKLRELIPRQQFEVPIQAAIGSRVIARENIRAIRKDVLAKCYGGDITRKRKLLEKQKEGKKRMKMVGRVEVPQEAFIAALQTNAPPAEPGAGALRPARRRAGSRRRRAARQRADRAGQPAVRGLRPRAVSARPAAATATSTPTPPPSSARGGDPAELARRRRSPRSALARRVLGEPARRSRRSSSAAARPTLLAPGAPRPAPAGGARDTFGLAAGAEVTTEANPETVDPATLRRAARGAASPGSRSGCRAPRRTCSPRSTGGTRPGGPPRRSAGPARPASSTSAST